ncbi:uncharacterized protein LOC143572584 [Bidens hawaiensis]|uniref:uncharacterized protein LOC143572584 n=1 Tax=Bidens hawaiensis TaxID=980011 RepID=UPI00404A65BC
MPSLSLYKIVLVFSVISVFSIFAMSNTEHCLGPYELVHQVCKKLNKHFCMGVLKSDTRSKFAKDITILTKIALNVATKNATKTQDYFLGVKTGTPAVMETLKDCINRYKNVISIFKGCLKEEDYCSVSRELSYFAGANVSMCQGDANWNGAYRSFITTSNTVTQDFVDLGVSLAELLCVPQTGA